jgi:transposase
VIGPTKAAQIQALARDTIVPPELAPQIGFEMELLIAQHDLLDEQIAQAEARVAGLLDGELARRLQTIPGVGAAICATLIAEIGDILRFSDFDQLVAYAGVHPAEESSGRKGANPETSRHMAKTGKRICPRGALLDERRRFAAQPHDQGALRPQARSGEVKDECPRAMHEEVARDRLGHLAR